MKAIEIQKQLNKTFSSRKPNYLKAFDLYNDLNTQRSIEGLSFLKLPNLEIRIAQIPLETVFNHAVNK